MTQTVPSYQTGPNADALGPQDKSAAEWKAALFMIAVMATVHTVATWDWDGQISAVNHALRHYGLPVVWLELVILLLSIRLGWSPQGQFTTLPTVIKWLCAGLIFSVITTSIFVSNSPITSMLFASRYLVHGLLIGSLIFLIGKDHNFQCSSWAIALSCGIALYLAALTTFCLFVPNPQSFPWVQRIPSATNIRQIGNVLGLMALAPACLLLFERSVQRVAIATFLLAAVLTFIMWSGSRGALLGFWVAIVIAGWRSRDTVDIGRAILFVVACAVALALSLLIPVPAPEFGMVRMAESFGTGDSSSGRWQIWQSAIEAIKTAPFLGHGAGTYRENMELLTGLPFNHPHNFILQFIYDWGILGGGLALGLLAWLGFFLLSSRKGKVEERFLSSSGFVGIITMAMIDGALFYPLPIIVLITLMAPHLVRHQA